MMNLELVYGVMVGASALLLIIMMFLGMDHGDANFDHDFGVGHDHDFHVGGADAHEFGGPSVIGFRLILAFILGFGVGGYLSSHYAWDLPHWITGIIFGFAFYMLVYWLLRLLYKQQANTIVNFSTLSGVKAIVTLPFDSETVGEVKAQDPKTGQVVYIRAKTSLERTLKKGEEVTVTSVSAGLANVK
jgi:membrane protein implicated in regulation of membrane protease activity